jgi:hypothetical protein
MDIDGFQTGAVNCLYENVPEVQRFQGESVLAPDLFKRARPAPNHAVAVTR